MTLIGMVSKEGLEYLTSSLNVIENVWTKKGPALLGLNNNSRGAVCKDMNRTECYTMKVGEARQQSGK